MSIISMRSQKRMLELSLSTLICIFVFMLQLLIIDYFDIHGFICSLPLSLIIVWGLVFGSHLPQITSLDLRKAGLKEIFTRQVLAGSPSGFLMGLLIGTFYASIDPVFPIALPLIGWVSGYFCLRSLSQGNLLCIPMVFILTILAEAISSWQLFILGRNGVFEHLSTFILTESLLNAIIAPFIYFPMRRWYEIIEGQKSSGSPLH